MSAGASPRAGRGALADPQRADLVGPADRRRALDRGHPRSTRQAGITSGSAKRILLNSAVSFISLKMLWQLLPGMRS